MALDSIQRGHVFKFRLLNTAFITLLPQKDRCCGGEGLLANKSNS